ncbi:MAG TPA: kynureninase [Chitinophagaceae bacterium]
MKLENTQDFAKGLDKHDPLKHFRDRFHIPQFKGKDKIYFTGNSLGLQPKTVSQYVQQELNDWAELGGEGHFEARRPWFPYHEIFSQQLSTIIGCLPEEVVVMNSLTVNLHLLLVSFYRPTQKRFKIICEYKAFPSDQYVFESQVKYHGFDPATAIIEVKPKDGEQTIQHEDIISAIREHGDSIAVVLLGGINYYTGQVFDMKAITEAAHAAGAYGGFDLAHAAGNIALHLHDWNVDFASWCTYKYLNSGPGAVGGAYIHQRHAVNKDLPRFAGWWGYTKETRFKMEKGFEAIPTAEGWQLSNAPVLSMAAHKAALDIFEEAGMEAIVKKGKQLSEYTIFVMEDINQRLPEKLISILTPTDEKERGCQVSIIIKKKGKEVFNYLMQHGVSVGWREPEVIRVAPVPLYNTFEDIWKFGNIIETVLIKGV